MVGNSNYHEPIRSFGKSEDDITCLRYLINEFNTISPVVRCKNLIYLDLDITDVSLLYGDLLYDTSFLNLQNLEELYLSSSFIIRWPNIERLFNMIHKLPRLHTIKIASSYIPDKVLYELYPYKIIGVPLDLSLESVRCAVLKWINVEEIRIYPPHHMYTLEMLAPLAELPNLKRVYFMDSYYDGAEWLSIAKQLMPQVHVQVLHNHVKKTVRVGSWYEKGREELRQKIKERADAERIKAGGKE